MPRELPRPITYLITDGETTSSTSPTDAEFRRLLSVVERAVAARLALVQLREKDLTARTLYELAAASARIARGSRTRILVNDRADIARAAECDGVHLSTRSLDARVVRRAFGEEFLIGVSTHNLAEARAAREASADFAVLGPVFDTPSKRACGPPLGLEALRVAALVLAPFPLVALGGIAEANVGEALDAGAAGVAGIRLFSNGQNLAPTVHLIQSLRAL
ncbi:MAG: thiamine-phosphate pyrophosphorylase [Acidobacteriota bacterium]|jgi:thiamine-phosphate pyrophosphorylase|nr:thiamine-phosphate pyrophosphorylase [Acidobacteriota bacterium]